MRTRQLCGEFRRRLCQPEGARLGDRRRLFAGVRRGGCVYRRQERNFVCFGTSRGIDTPTRRIAK